MKQYNPLQAIFASMLAIFASVMMTSQAFAHPGHDHQAPESMLVHVLFYGSIVAAVAICAWFGYRYYKKSKS